MGKSCRVGLSLSFVFSIFKAILPLELSIGPSRLERETRIHKSPIPVPTGITDGPQAGKEGMIYWKEKVGSSVFVRTVELLTGLS
jgi:hypothetical protein